MPVRFEFGDSLPFQSVVARGWSDSAHLLAAIEPHWKGATSTVVR